MEGAFLGTDKQLQDMYQLCFNIPKIELHSHIGGNLRPATFLELAEKEGISVDHIDFYNVTLKGAFDIFAVVGKILNSLDVLQRVIREIVEDYSKTNTRYLELRSGPKAFGENTKEDYIKAVVEVLEECETLFPHITVRLLVSINRSAPMESNLEAYELAKKYIVDEKCKYIVGLEFSGNPKDNSFEDYCENIFNPAREAGIKISVHTAEIEDHHEETEKILDFKPDRLGHCCYMNEEEFKRVAELEIPVEVCISSNVGTMNLSTISQIKHIPTLHSMGCTIIPCCDDTMLFNTNMINETFELVNMLKLEEEELKSILNKGIDAIFDDEVKALLASET
ncbi:unnamed protein product [Moneuplotes crassus]|uniref:Adenosine deaminase domain-containing protein n=1 Tax=Euplotes crassus TaxID=5936 RepID=A0AAD1UUT9_EUPCR|nr:unnamed protein product [Moneuplotes crassus]